MSVPPTILIGFAVIALVLHAGAIRVVRECRHVVTFRRGGAPVIFRRCEI
jgi:hypothetical protein